MGDSRRQCTGAALTLAVALCAQRQDKLRLVARRGWTVSDKAGVPSTRIPAGPRSCRRNRSVLWPPRDWAQRRDSCPLPPPCFLGTARSWVLDGEEAMLM